MSVVTCVFLLVEMPVMSDLLVNLSLPSEICAMFPAAIDQMKH